jgi:hypothetical protein
MKSQGINRWFTLGAVVCIALAIAQSSWSQEKEKTYPRKSSDPYAAKQIEAAKKQANEARKQVEAAREQAKAALWQNDRFKFVIATGGHRENAELSQAAEAVRDAKNEEEQADAKAKLQGLLEDVFEEDMNRRKDALVEMESRLRKLQLQLEQRRDKMEEIVELQAKVLINEANGLGFYSGGSQSIEVPININEQNNHFKGPHIEYRPTPVRITAPIPAPTISPAAAPEPAQPPAPPEPAAADEEDEGGRR